VTRRETLVKFLQGDNGFSASQLEAAFAVPGTTAFLTEAQSRGITNAELADRLVAFKKGGGCGLQNAIESITQEWNAPAVVEDPKAAVYTALDALRSAIEGM
jgi:hypothetical protein